MQFIKNGETLPVLAVDIDLIPVGKDNRAVEGWTDGPSSAGVMYEYEEYTIGLTGFWGRGSMLALTMCGLGETMPTIHTLHTLVTDNETEALAQLNHAIAHLMSAHLLPFGWKVKADI